MKAEKINEEDVLGYECKFALHVPAPLGEKTDYHLIKERVHMKDGSQKSRLRSIANYQRPFYITREKFRNHEDKKEEEEESKLQKFMCTQSELVSAISRAIGRPGLSTTLKRLCRNPYIYGADISSTAIIKKSYMQRFPDCVSSNTVAAFDIETDVVEGHELPIIVGLTFKKKRIVTVLKEFLGSIIDPIPKVRKLFTEHLGQYETPEDEFIIKICDTPGQCIDEVMKKAHEWGPDFISIWNINFDIPQILNALEKENYNIADVFSDPRVPAAYRFAEFVRGPNQKKTATGKITPIHWTEQWHTMRCPASFYFIDSACVYRRNRIAKGMEVSYSLDYILEKNLGLRKLKFDELLEKDAPHIRPGTLAWHMHMQKYHKLEYIIYNLFDCISLELLDEKTKDLSDTISVLNEHSDYSNFASQPRRIADDLHFFFQEQEPKRIIGTTSDQMADENNEYVIGMGDWILTLPAHLKSHNGLLLFDELPDLRSSVFVHNFDLDVSGTYPTVELLWNISKATTFRELSSIEGIDDITRRSIGVNMTGGKVNAVEICCEIYKAPSFETLLHDFESSVIN